MRTGGLIRAGTAVLPEWQRCSKAGQSGMPSGTCLEALRRVGGFEGAKRQFRNRTKHLAWPFWQGWAERHAFWHMLEGAAEGFGTFRGLSCKAGQSGMPSGTCLEALRRVWRVCGCKTAASELYKTPFVAFLALHGS